MREAGQEEELSRDVECGLSLAPWRALEGELCPRVGHSEACGGGEGGSQFLLLVTG